MTKVKIDLQRLLDDGVALRVAQKSNVSDYQYICTLSDDRTRIHCFFGCLTVIIYKNADVVMADSSNDEISPVLNQFAIHELLAPYNILDRIEEGKFGEWLEGWGFNLHKKDEWGNQTYERTDEYWRYRIDLDLNNKLISILKTKIPKIGGQGISKSDLGSRYDNCPIPTSKAFAIKLLESLGIRKGENHS